MIGLGKVNEARVELLETGQGDLSSEVLFVVEDKQTWVTISNGLSH